MTTKEPIHVRFTTIGLDITNIVLQVYGIDAAEKVIVSKHYAAVRL